MVGDRRHFLALPFISYLLTLILLGSALVAQDASTGALRENIVHITERVRLEFSAESFNLFNRDNQRYNLSEDGFVNSAGQFVSLGRKPNSGLTYPAYYQQPTNFLKANSAYAPRLVQMGLKLLF